MLACARWKATTLFFIIDLKWFCPLSLDPWNGGSLNYPRVLVIPSHGGKLPVVPREGSKSRGRIAREEGSGGGRECTAVN